MMPSQCPESEWAGLVADALLFAAARQQKLCVDASLHVDEIIRRLWLLPEPRTEAELCDAQWRLFCFRAMVGTIEHAHSLAHMSPGVLHQALQQARQVGEWDFAETFEGAMDFLERQTAVHREIAQLVSGRISCPAPTTTNRALLPFGKLAALPIRFGIEPA
jgi:hypothetical protein